jgi:hypothetical protein
MDDYHECVGNSTVAAATKEITRFVKFINFQLLFSLKVYIVTQFECLPVLLNIVVGYNAVRLDD